MQDKPQPLTVDQKRCVNTIYSEIASMCSLLEAENNYRIRDMSWNNFRKLHGSLSVNLDLHPDMEDTVKLLEEGAKKMATLKYMLDENDKKYREIHMSQVWIRLNRIYSYILRVNQLTVPEQLPLKPHNAIRDDYILSVSKTDDPQRVEVLGEKLTGSIRPDKVVRYNLGAGLAYTTWNKTANFYHIKSGYLLIEQVRVTQAQARRHYAYLADTIDIDQIVAWAEDPYVLVPESLYYEMRRYYGNTDYALGGD